MARYFKIPFASTGDKVVIPDATQPDGSVSFTQGFGFDYERPNTDPAYKPVPREGTNGILHDVTEAVGVMQRQGVADWTIDAQPYPINALVRHADKVWLSLVANNNVTPIEGASWMEVGALASETVAGLVEIATTAEAQALVNDTHALTPAKLAAAFKGSNQLLDGGSGYQRLPGGLIIQWGKDITSGGTVTWPIAFPNDILVAVVSDTAISTPIYNHAWDRNASTKTQGRFLTSGSIANSASYIALGY